MSDPIAEAIARLRARQGPQRDEAVRANIEPSVEAVRMQAIGESDRMTLRFVKP